MKQIVRWLKTTLSRPESHSHSDAPNQSENARLDLDTESSTDLPNLVIDAPMPDIYAEDELEETVPDLKLRDSRTPGTDTSPDFNPYDTAQMHKK
jgi:hypothetical protein